ncbi:MAG TPA: hypothetical protein VFE32_14120 [Puia sp.]|jgi:hypothetical protein|nr:hypothetical protein [Puia sp.]
MATSTPAKQPTDDNWLGEYDNKLPTTLNVLTILTFIYNGLFGFLAIVNFFRAKANYETLAQNPDSIDKLPDFAKRFMGPHPLETARLALENRVPILLIALIGYFLCFYGALQMRKLKKVGFSLYVLGDIVPFATYIFIGTDALTGSMAAFVVGIGFLAVFIILYATQLKAMK